MELQSFLDQKFKNSKKVTLGECVEPTKQGATIPSGTLVVIASGDRKLRLKILDTATPHKGFSEPLRLNSFAITHRVSPQYLLWYLSQPPVSQWLILQTTGSVLLRVPRRVLYSISVPLPTRVREIRAVSEVVLTKSEGQFSVLLDGFYRDYVLNFDKGRYRTAAILAGAICELILYQLLLESDVDAALLKRDRNLGLSKMLDYLRLLKLDQAEGFPLNHLVEVQKNRNHAVHAGLQVTDHREFSETDLDCFNHIIRYFGI